jgi:hypothetical protein
LLALVMIFSATAALAGPASSTPSSFNYGNRFGDIRNQDNGEHVGAGVGGQAQQQPAGSQITPPSGFTVTVG